jgi:2'-5' RNA ligase
LEKIRTFIAIEIPDEIKAKNIHLTLKFLGYIEAEKIEPIGSALDRAREGIKPFTVTVGGLGAFPNLKSPRVIWVGVSESDDLKRLYKNIEEELYKIGFEKERRPFHPHLTLLRVKTRDEARRLAQRTRDIKGDLGVSFLADEFILFKSKLSPRGAEYSKLKRISLKEGSR